MEFFKANTQIQFMKQRIIAAIFSAIIIIASLTALCVNGLNLGLDFTGGNQAMVSFSTPIDVNAIRQGLEKNGFPEVQVQSYGLQKIAVRVGLHKELSVTDLKNQLLAHLPSDAQMNQFDYVGPQVGKQLLTNGVLAVVVALMGTMIYIALRFDYRFAVSAAVALIHDPLLIIGVFALFHLEFNMIVLTAVLTVIGYSLNDTIVVYDRVRENFRKIRKKTPKEIMDLSINDTLSRTIMTSGLTLLVVIALFIYGGETIHGFALALMIGIVIGTYSSIYVAGSMAIALGLNRQNLLQQANQSLLNEDGSAV